MKNKIQKKVLLFLIILFAIIIAAYLKYYYVYPHFTRKNISSYAVERMFNKCRKMGSATPEHLAARSDCYKTVIEKFSDLSMCKKITIWESRKDCYDYYGKENKNPDLCKTQNCFEYLASVLNNPSLCAKTNDVCIAVAKADISLCDKIDSLYNKALCYSKLGVKLSNIQFCEEALKIDTIRNEELYKGYAEVNGREYKGLDSSTESILKTSEQYCIKDAIVRKKDFTSCEKIEESYMRDKCYNEIAIELNYISICDKIGNVEQKVGCELVFAQKEGDVFACNKLEKTTSEENWDQKYLLAKCYEDIIVETGDPSLCEKISEINNDMVEREYKDYCYWRIAARSNNFSLCSKINDEEIKSDCSKKILPSIPQL